MTVQTVAIIGAMEQETELLKNRLEAPETFRFGAFEAYRGRLAGKTVVLARSGIGKVNAAVTAAWVVNQFAPDAVVNTGSAGGLGKGLKVGDVVIGLETAHHDVDVTAFGYTWGQVPQLPARYAADAALAAAATEAAQAFEGAAVVQGLVVSGDQFVHSSDKVAEIRSRFEGVQAVEMEAAAIAQSCHQLGVPFVVVRAVSDSADEKAGISFETFLETAAVSSADMVLRLLERLA